jgi:hypothetical protein
MRHRKLRIAWSVTWGFLAVLLIALWVRSYALVDNVRRVGTANVWVRSDVSGVRSEFGNLRVVFGKQTITSGASGWSITHDKSKPKHDGFKWHSGEDYVIAVDFPHWSLVLLFVTMSASPWLLHLTVRFGLRTLLIATTLVAIVLGLIVWAVK